MNRYGLVVQINETTKTARFIRLHDLLLSGGHMNWTDKVDSFISESYNVGTYGRANYYRYADDEENEMTGRFNINDETLNEEQTVFQSSLKKPKYWPALYYAELARGVFKIGQGQAWPLIDVAETSVQDYNVVPPVSQSKEIPFSLMYLKDFEGTVNLTFTAPEGSSTNNFPVKIATRDFLEFQGFLDTNYPEVVNLLNNVIIVKARMKLSVMDIYQFDFFKRVYLEQYGSYFYVNRISNFQKDKLTEVELVKILPSVL